MVGQTLGQYTIESQLGKGGMGVVYLATDTRLGRRVAIKVLDVASMKDAERLARFEREARLLASLNHPNIGAIHGLERAGEMTFLVLEYIPGETLAERIGRLVIFNSLDDDEPIKQRVRELVGIFPTAQLVEFKDRGHFRIGHNMTGPEFPELLDAVIDRRFPYQDKVV